MCYFCQVNIANTQYKDTQTLHIYIQESLFISFITLKAYHLHKYTQKPLTLSFCYYRENGLFCYFFKTYIKQHEIGH